jgi:hypothetical protein
MRNPGAGVPEWIVRVEQYHYQISRSESWRRLIKDNPRSPLSWVSLPHKRRDVLSRVEKVHSPDMVARIEPESRDSAFIPRQTFTGSPNKLLKK